MAQRHRRRTYLGTNWSSLSSVMNKLIGPAVFLAQLTSKDQGVIGNQPTTGATVKTLINDVTGRITGINIFSDVPKFGQTVNPAGIINPYSTVAVGGIIVGSILRKFGIRGGAQIRGLSARALVPAMVGGFFDPPEAGSGSTRAAQAQANEWHPGNIGYSSGGGTSYGGVTNRSYSMMAATAGGNVTGDISARSM